METSDFTAAQQYLNEALAEAVAAANCWGGRLLLRPLDAPHEPGLVSIRGHLPSGADRLVWPLTPALLEGVARYAAEMPPGRGYLTLDVDLGPPAFAYHHASADGQAQAEAAAPAQVQQSRYRDLRQHLSPAPYGPALAAQVAAALAQGHWFNYGHPAYCGMGLELQEGQYCYGPVWEGTLEPELTFPDAATFSTWLAQQSDLSLALLDSPDYTFWHNQTVTRARLLELVQPSVPASD